MTFYSRQRLGWWAVAFLAMACSSSGDETGSTSGGGGASNVGQVNGGQVVGTTGATVTQNGVTLAVPANALTSDTPITVSVTAPPSGYSLLSKAYEFGPSGTTFLQPVAVTIPLTSADPDAHLFWSNASGGFDDLGGMVNGLAVTANVTHFSVGFCAKSSRNVGTGGQGGAGGAPGAGGAGGIASTGGSSGAGGIASTGGSSGVGGAGGASSVDASMVIDAGTVTMVSMEASNGAGGASIDAGTSTDVNTSSTDATGAGGATSDATVVDSGGPAVDAASLCAPFGLNLPGALVTYMDGSAPPDPSSYTGGTLISARFTLAGVTHYGSGQYTGTRQAVYTIDATAQTIQIAQFSGYVGMTYVNVAPNKLLGTVVCNTGMTGAPPTFSYYYTATGATIKLTEEGSPDVLTINAPVN
jgi:hypothetical protein